MRPHAVARIQAIFRSSGRQRSPPAAHGPPGDARQGIDEKQPRTPRRKEHGPLGQSLAVSGIQVPATSSRNPFIAALQCFQSRKTMASWPRIVSVSRQVRRLHRQARQLRRPPQEYPFTARRSRQARRRSAPADRYAKTLHPLLHAVDFAAHELRAAAYDLRIARLG